jgi:hypothetical protein
MNSNQDLTVFDLWRYLVTRRAIVVAAIALGGLTGFGLSLLEPKAHSVEAVLRLRSFSPVHPSLTSLHASLRITESRDPVNLAALVGTIDAAKSSALFGPHAADIIRARIEDARAGEGHFRLLLLTLRPDRAAAAMDAAVTYLNSLPALKLELDFDRKLMEAEVALIEEALADYRAMAPGVRQALGRGEASRLGFNPIDLRIDAMNLELRRMQLQGWMKEFASQGNLGLATPPVVSLAPARPQTKLNVIVGLALGTILGLLLAIALGVARDYRRKGGVAA